ncbi:MAG: helicase-related protein, partial [Candidatus Sigynarchaeota archaeon]
EGGPGKYKLLSRLATCIKLHHAVELLETYGVDSLLDYHDSLVDDFKKRGTKATQEVLLDQGYNKAIALAADIKRAGETPARHHPKLLVLRQLLAEFLARNPSSRILVFVNYRASIDAIIDHVGPGDPVIRIHRFVGQGTRKKADAGMKRDAQSKLLQQFKAGTYNVLVATSVAEEGLDIAECDLVVFYETVASLVKFVQRRGRTGRKRAGNVAVLFTRGTMDEFRMKALDAKLSRIRGVYYNIVNAASGPGVALLDAPAPKPRPKLQQRIEAFVAAPSPPGNGGRDPVRQPGRDHDPGRDRAAREPHVSITDLKRWQDAVPVVVSGDSIIAGTLPGLLEAARVPVSVVPPSGLPDITIGRGLAIKVLPLASVARASLDGTIFGILEGLKALYDKAFLVAWDDGRDLGDDEITKEMIVDWLERFADLSGIKVIATSNAGVLARVVRDFHDSVKGSRRHSARQREQAIA